MRLVQQVVRANERSQTVIYYTCGHVKRGIIVVTNTSRIKPEGIKCTMDARGERRGSVEENESASSLREEITWTLRDSATFLPP